MSNMSVESSTTDLRPDEPQHGPDAGLLLNAIAKIIFYSLVMLLGLFGNSLILGVYWPKPNKTSTQILIMGLAGMDLTVCLMRVYNLTMYLMFIQNKETPSVVEYIGVIGLVNMFASSVLTGFIALDRYDCVCRRPADRLLNRSRAKMMILFELNGCRSSYGAHRACKFKHRLAGEVLAAFPIYGVCRFASGTSPPSCNAPDYVEQVQDNL